MKNQILFLAIYILVLNATFHSKAANIIDPNSVGATDVIQEPFGSTTTLSNPLADPLSLGADDLGVGGDSHGELLIDGGSSVVNTIGYVGVLPTSDGTVTVTGSGSRWDNSSDLNIGVFGEAELNVLSAGVVSSTEGYVGLGEGSTGVATISGSGSLWHNWSDLYVGNLGNGTLNIETRAVVNSETGFIGRHVGSTGVATVTGADSQWNNTGLFLGGTEDIDGGMGTLNLPASGHVNVGNDLYNGFLGNRGGVIVSASNANGKLWVRNGSTITNSGGGLIGFLPSATGLAVVTGTGSQWDNADDLFVGVSGDGTLSVEAGGVVNNRTGYIARYSGSEGLASRP